MDAAQPCKAGIPQRWNHFENSQLRAVFHLGLKAYDVVKRAQFVIAAQLHHRIGLLRVVRIGQAHRLHRAKPQGLGATFGHHLDRQAAVEIACGFFWAELSLFGGQKGCDKGVILRLVHRAVHIGGLFFDGFALVIARLHPRHRHIDRFGIDDGGDGIKKRQGLGVGMGADAVREGGGGQRAGGDDPLAVGRQFGNFLIRYRHEGMAFQFGGNKGRKRIAVHRQGTACGQAVRLGRLQDQPIGRAHFPMQQAHGVLLAIV